MSYPPVFRDLYSLYEIIRKAKIISVLEFGCGWSTLVIALALKENSDLYADYVSEKIRHPNPFKALIIDTSAKFLNIASKRIPTELLGFLEFHKSKCQMTVVRDQVAHLYSDIPPWTADFVYLDGPDCDHVDGNVNGMTVNFGDEAKPYGLPMGADLIRLEPYFWPGTKILIDGRGANSYFLKHNFNRNWIYSYDDRQDQHHFELVEEPWGGGN